MKKLPPNATTYTAVALVTFGLILIFLAWNAAASPDNGVDLRAQFPYLLSGGLGGLALIGAGLTLIRVFEARRDNKEVLDRLDRLTAVVERLEALRSAQQPAEDPATALTGPLPRDNAAPSPAPLPPPTGPFEPAQ